MSRTPRPRRLLAGLVGAMRLYTMLELLAIWGSHSPGFSALLGTYLYP